MSHRRKARKKNREGKFGKKMVAPIAIPGGATCSRKTWYPTKGAARDAAKRRNRVADVKLIHYKCPYCPCWHVGRFDPNIRVGARQSVAS